MKGLYFLLLPLSLFILIVACSGLKAQEVVHPKKEFIPGPKGNQIIIISSKNTIQKENPNVKLYSYNNRLQTIRSVAQIGKRQGKKQEMFGQIAGIVNDEDGNIYVLDKRYNKIKVYNSSGEFLYSIGRGGRGPGEFYQPNSITMGEKGLIFVADRGNKIHIFESINEEYKYKTSFIIHYPPDDICVMDGNLYLRAIGRDRNEKETFEFKTIHKYSLDGKYLESFGEPYQYSNTFIKKQISDGKIACIPKAGVVISTFDWMPYLFAYTDAGNLKWKAVIKPFTSPPLLEKNGISFSIPNVEYPIDYIQFLTPIKNSKLLLIQVNNWTSANDNPFEGAFKRTFLIDTEVNSYQYIGKNLPFINAANANHLYSNAIIDSLFPNIVVYQY